MAIVLLGAFMLVPPALAVWGFAGMSARRAWRTVALVLFAVGIAAGFLGASAEWRPSPTSRYFGFPFPHTIFQLENGIWIDYVTGLAPFIVFVNFVWLAFAGPVLTGALFASPRGQQPRRVALRDAG